MQIEELTAKAWRKFEPPPDLKVSEWACAHRRLSPESSAEPGEFSMDRTPFMRAVVDTFNDPLVEETVLMKSSQVGYSENLNNIVAYIMDQNPGPIMLMQPTLEMAESYSKDRISPMIRDTPRLKKLVDERSKKSGNTILHKSFPGGLLQMVGANSPASLASRPIRDLLGDEPDRYPASAGEEGDPWKIAGKRQITFFDRKRFLGGTPTIKKASRIAKAYEKTDKRKYHVPCPRCGVHIPLDRDRFDHVIDSENYARYQCQACDGWIDEHERFDMIRDEPAGGTAHWRATAEGDGRRAGFFIWAAYSPFVGWREIFDEWNEAKGDPEEEQVVHNTLFGEAYEFQTVELDHEDLFKRREDYDGQRLPNAVEIITAGIDTQDDRFEIEIVGWGAGEESWSIEYATIEGDPDLPATRDALDAFIADAVFHREDGREMIVSAAFIDSAGHRTDAVYKFARGKQHRHIYPSKGSSVAGQPIFARFSPQKSERVKLAIVGTDTAKEIIYARLARGNEARGRCHFPLSYALEYFSGLTSEEKKITWTKGGPVVRFVKRKGEGKSRNEPLDCRVYALAALRSLPMALRRLRRAERAAMAPPPDDPSSPESSDDSEAPQPDPVPEATPAQAARTRRERRKTNVRRQGGGWSAGW